MDTLAGGFENSGIRCTECKDIFCDDCYDTGLGDGCHCHSEKQRTIIKCFEASTAHISFRDNELLQMSCEGSGVDIPGGPITYAYEHGFFVYAYETGDAKYDAEYLDDCKKFGLSDEFVALVVEARANGCKYLQLDADATVYDDLPKFDW